MCYWNRKCCAKLRFGGLLGTWERWTVVVFFMIWPQFGGRTGWRSSFDSCARALAKLAVTNEFSSFALARRIIKQHPNLKMDMMIERTSFSKHHACHIQCECKSNPVWCRTAAGHNLMCQCERGLSLKYTCIFLVVFFMEKMATLCGEKESNFYITEY